MTDGDGAESGPGTAAGEPRWLVSNRAAWDERVPLHVASAFYGNDSFLAGRSSLRDFEVTELGSVAGLDLCHLQCHFGQDTLSWARLGARVTGLDFSPVAVDAARALAARAGIDATFVVGDVYDARSQLGDTSYDVVYTGLGALVWLPDLAGWAEVCASLLRPGGTLYLAEMHPFTDVFCDDELLADYDYFGRPEGTRYEDPGSYVDRDAPTEHNETYEWTHPVSSVITAVLGAGLALESFHEHDFTLFERWPFLERHDDFTYRMPADRPRLPLLYSLRARKPSA